jgi:hypothetical protein
MRKRIFGRERDLIAGPTFLRIVSDDALRRAIVAVDACGVDEVHPHFARAVLHGERRLLAGADAMHGRLFLGLTEGHGAEADRGGFETGAIELAVVHGARTWLSRGATGRLQPRRPRDRRTSTSRGRAGKPEGSRR